MKKYLLLFVLTVLMLSCSKTVKVEGKISSATPTDRLELIDVSTMAAFPVANFGVAKDGTVKGSFEAPHDGMYVLTFAGRQAMVYLKGGEDFKFAFDALAFPGDFKVLGDAKNDYDFLRGVQDFVTPYSGKIQMRELLAGDEKTFLKEMEKIKKDLEDNIEETAEKTKPSKSLINFKKDEVVGSVLGLMSQYEVNHAMLVQNPKFKVSQAFRDYEKKLDENGDRMIKEQSVYRNYMLNKIASDYQQFAEKNAKNNEGKINSQVFADYLDTRKDLSQTVKDYLLANVMTQFDMNQGVDQKDQDKYTKVIDGKIKDAGLKTDLKKMLFVLVGPKMEAPAPDNGLEDLEGKAYKFSALKGKPAVLMFYAGWNMHLKDSAIPVIKEVTNFYKAKMNFVYVNLDDTKEDFKKTASLFKGIPGVNVYAEGGLNSTFAKDWGLYSFKIPSFVVIDKDGKVASKLYGNLGDQELINIMDKLTGLKAPTAAPAATLQNDIFQTAPAPAK